jgi:hypothetical protein
MKFKELILEDKLICLRVKNDIAVHINLKITSIACDNFSVISDTLDTYTFDAPIDKEINGKLVFLDNGGDNYDDEIREYLFETLEDCKKFAIEYCEKKIKSYEKTIRSIKSW